VDSDYIFGGVYSRFDWVSQFFDFTLQGGATSNKSTRSVMSNLAASGFDSATASYRGWYINPELAYGVRSQLGNGFVLTPTARVRYLAAMVDGYSETGSAQSLSVAARTLAELRGARRGRTVEDDELLRCDHALKASVHGGVIAQQRMFDTMVSTVLIGQNLSFAAPRQGQHGRRGGLGRARLLHDQETCRCSAAVEGQSRTPTGAATGTAKSGVRVTF